MTLKQEHYIFGMLGLAAVAVLYFLYKESQTAQSAVPNPDGISGAGVVPMAPSAQSYPSIAPIQLGDVILQQAPHEQLYNTQLDGAQLPRVKIGTAHSECGCEDDDCEAAGTLVSVQTIPDHVFQAAVKNLHSYIAKGSA